MTLQGLASALQARRAGANEKGHTNSPIPDSKLVGFYTRCGRCGKPLFMDDSLIVEQSTSVEQFLERCARRLFEHRCDSESTPQI
jgi:hypothetical protein